MRFMDLHEAPNHLPIYPSDLKRAIKKRQLPHYQIGDSIWVDLDEIIELSRVEVESNLAPGTKMEMEVIQS